METGRILQLSSPFSGVRRAELSKRSLLRRVVVSHSLSPEGCSQPQLHLHNVPASRSMLPAAV
eukprot:4114547-Heterocapsa_arctica.AAC.1